MTFTDSFYQFKFIFLFIGVNYITTYCTCTRKAMAIDFAMAFTVL